MGKVSEIVAAVIIGVVSLAVWERIARPALDAVLKKDKTA